LNKLTIQDAAALLLLLVPTVARAQQPAAPPPAADRAATAAILGQIAALQQQQLLALQQLAGQQPRPVLDDRRACVLADQAYSEGAPAKAVDGKTYVCTRVYPNAGQGHERLMWLAAPAAP
jgi:hypothetical protein